RKVLDWENRSGGLTCVAFSPDGQMMATAGMRLGLLKSATGVVKWRQTKEGAVEQSLVVQDGPINSADFSPDGKTLALTTGYRWSQFKSKPRGLLKLVGKKLVDRVLTNSCNVLAVIHAGIYFPT